MPNDAELIKKYDSKLAELLTHMHNDGLGLSVIIMLLDQKLGNLKLLDHSLTHLGSAAPERVQKALETPVVVD